MKIFTIFTVLCIFSSVLSAQVGVNTTTPQETLDVEGTMRVGTTNQAAVTTTKVLGLNANGNLRDVVVGTNLTLATNVLSARSNTDHSFGTISLLLEDHNNVDLLIGPGQTNDGKSIIRLNRTITATGKLTVTGFVAGYDGQHVWIYAQQGVVTLKANDLFSLAANRIEVNDKLGAKAWGMIELVYDGSKSKWIVMTHHQ